MSETYTVGETKSGSFNLYGPLNGPYAHSFGALPDKTPYQKASAEIDMRKELKAILINGIKNAEAKALLSTTGGAGTAGHALVPVYVDTRIVDLTRKWTPWIELTARVTNLGKEADFNKLTAKGGGFSAAEDGAMADRSNTYSRDTTSIKYLYAVGRVTGQAQAAIPPYMLQGLQPSGTGTATATFNSPAAPNAKQLEVLVQAQALREYEEETLWTGDITSTATDFSGIVKLQGTTNQLDKATSAFDFDDIDFIANLAYTSSGRPGIMGCDSSTLKDIRKIMVDHFRFKPGDLTGTAGFGVPASLVIDTMIGAMPIIPSQFLSTTTGEKQLFMLDQEYIEMRVLQDMTFETLAKTNDSEKFLLKIYEALLLRAPQFNALVDNIS